MVSSLLSEEKYVQDVTEFAKNSKGDVWTLTKTDSGIIAKQSSICRYNHQVINRQSQFVYNKKLSRLELWFMFYCRNGRPLRVREIAEILGTKPEQNDAIVIELSTHPTLRIPYYKLYENPDDSSDLMSLIENCDNYVSSWIIAFGAEAGLTTDYIDTSSSSCGQSVTGSDDS